MENNTEIRKTETLHIRLTPDDKQLIEQYAKMMNFSMSAFIEILLHRKRIIVCENLGELIIQLSRIGNNINQITRRCNSGYPLHSGDLQEIRKELDLIWQLLRLYLPMRE